MPHVVRRFGSSSPNDQRNLQTLQLLCSSPDEGDGSSSSEYDEEIRANHAGFNEIFKILPQFPCLRELHLFVDCTWRASTLAEVLPSLRNLQVFVLSYDDNDFRNLLSLDHSILRALGQLTLLRSLVFLSVFVPTLDPFETRLEALEQLTLERCFLQKDSLVRLISKTSTALRRLYISVTPEWDPEVIAALVRKAGQDLTHLYLELQAVYAGPWPRFHIEPSPSAEAFKYCSALRHLSLVDYLVDPRGLCNLHLLQTLRVQTSDASIVLGCLSGNRALKRVELAERPHYDRQTAQERAIQIQTQAENMGIAATVHYDTGTLREVFTDTLMDALVCLDDANDL